MTPGFGLSTTGRPRIFAPEGTVKLNRFTPPPPPSSNEKGGTHRTADGLHWQAGLQMTTPTTLEDIARQALDGDREALDALVRALQGDIYGLALRILDAVGLSSDSTP